MLANRATRPASMANSPTRTTRRGETSGRNRGMPAAARSRVIDNGRIRIPVSMADNPRATDRYSGMVKNKPAWIRYWNKNKISPPTS
jgi:hypothetical protein